MTSALTVVPARGPVFDTPVVFFPGYGDVSLTIWGKQKWPTRLERGWPELSTGARRGVQGRGGRLPRRARAPKGTRGLVPARASARSVVARVWAGAAGAWGRLGKQRWDPAVRGLGRFPVLLRHGRDVLADVLAVCAAEAARGPPLLTPC